MSNRMRDAKASCGLSINARDGVSADPESETIPGAPPRLEHLTAGFPQASDSSSPSNCLGTCNQLGTCQSGHPDTRPAKKSQKENLRPKPSNTASFKPTVDLDEPSGLGCRPTLGIAGPSRDLARSAPPSSCFVDKNSYATVKEDQLVQEFQDRCDEPDCGAVPGSEPFNRPDAHTNLIVRANKDGATDFYISRILLTQHSPMAEILVVEKANKPPNSCPARPTSTLSVLAVPFAATEVHGALCLLDEKANISPELTSLDDLVKAVKVLEWLKISGKRYTARLRSVVANLAEKEIKEGRAPVFLSQAAHCELDHLCKDAVCAVFLLEHQPKQLEPRPNQLGPRPEDPSPQLPGDALRFIEKNVRKWKKVQHLTQTLFGGHATHFEHAWMREDLVDGFVWNGPCQACPRSPKRVAIGNGVTFEVAAYWIEILESLVEFYKNSSTVWVASPFADEDFSTILEGRSTKICHDCMDRFKIDLCGFINYLNFRVGMFLRSYLPPPPKRTNHWAYH